MPANINKIQLNWEFHAMFIVVVVIFQHIVLIMSNKDLSHTVSMELYSYANSYLRAINTQQSDIAMAWYFKIIVKFLQSQLMIFKLSIKTKNEFTCAMIINFAPFVSLKNLPFLHGHSPATMTINSKSSSNHFCKHFLWQN